MGTKLADERGIKSDLLRDAEKNANDYPIQYNIDFNPSNANKIRSLGWILGFRYDKNNKDCYEKQERKKYLTFDDSFNRGHITLNGYFSANVPYGDAEPDYTYIYVDEFSGNYNDTLLASLEKTSNAIDLPLTWPLSIDGFPCQLIPIIGRSSSSKISFPFVVSSLFVEI